MVGAELSLPVGHRGMIGEPECIGVGGAHLDASVTLVVPAVVSLVVSLVVALLASLIVVPVASAVVVPVASLVVSLSVVP